MEDDIEGIKISMIVNCATEVSSGVCFVFFQ